MGQHVPGAPSQAVFHRVLSSDIYYSVYVDGIDNHEIVTLISLESKLKLDG